MIQDSAATMRAAVAETLDALDLTPADTAAKKLAVRYAQVIDDAADTKIRAWAMRNVGPLLLDTLEALGATPRARNAKGGKRGDAPKSKLQALRDARQA